MSEPKDHLQTLTVEQCMDLIPQLYSAGHLSEAEELFQQILLMEPEQPFTLNSLGLVAYQMGNIERSLDLFEQALLIKPDLANAYFNLGSVLLHVGQLENAVANYRKALAIDPDSAITHNDIGSALIGLGQHKEAEKHLKKSIAIDPNNALTYFNLGTLLFDVHQLENAVTNYRKALAIDPDSAMILNDIGSALIGLGQHKEAEGHLKKAITIDPNNAHAHFNLGLVFEESGRQEDCITAYREATRLNPDFYQAHFCLGKMLVMCGRIEDAIGCFEKCAEINPEEVGLKDLKTSAKNHLKMLEDVLKPDLSVTVANSIENFYDDTFMENHKKTLAKKRGDNKIILVVSFPKSGSTFLARTLKKISKSNLFRLCYRYEQNEHDLYLPYLSMWNKHGVVSLLHMKATKPNVELINLFGIQPVITVRNIYDTIASLVNNLNQGKHDATKALGNSFLWQDEPIQALSDERKIDYMIDMAVPWCIIYYVSWVYFTKTNQCQAIWVEYDKQMDNWETTLRNVCDFVGIGHDCTDAELSNFKQPRTSPYNAGNPELGMNVLSKKQKMKILDMVSYYPEVDFAEHGFLNRGPDGNYSLDL